jgi:glycerol uptake facilitator-like aquaporin
MPLETNDPAEKPESVSESLDDAGHRTTIGVVALQKRLIAEFLGSYALLLSVFVVIAARSRSLVDPVALDLGRYATLGLSLFVVVSIFDGTSAHFNPAVSLGHAVAKKLSWRDFAAYSAVQTIASLLAAISATVLVGGPTRRVLPNAARVSSGRAFLYEFVATLLLVATYFATENDLRAVRPFFVGAAGVCAALTIGRFTTLGVNPARTFGAALWNRFGSTTWIFLVAPLLAGLVVGLVTRFAPTASSSSSQALVFRGVGEFLGTFLTLFLGLAGIRAVGGIIGYGIYYLGPPALLLTGSLLLRSRTYFNPAITIAAALAKRIRTVEALVLLTAQITGAILAANGLRSWLQGDTRRLLEITPLDRITPVRLLVFEAIAAAMVLVVALRQNHRILGPAAVAVTTFAMAVSISGFGRSNTNPAWAIGTATGWEFTTEPRHLLWLVGGPLISAVIIGVFLRRGGTRSNTIEAIVG